MKKLLAILGSLTMIVGGAASVVACGQKDDEKDDTGSVFIDPNGELKIDSEALLRWYLEHNGVGLGNKQLKEFFQLFAVGILKESEKGDDSFFKDINPSEDKNQYAFEDLQKTLEKKWGTKNNDDSTTVQGAALSAWNKKLEKRKKEVGEDNVQKDLTNELAKTFPYVKKDFETLKKAYINNQILTGSEESINNSAMQVLIKILTNQYSQEYSARSTETGIQWEPLLTSFIENWRNINVSEIAKEIKDYVEKPDLDKKEAKYLNLVNVINATGGKKTDVATGASKKIWELKNVDWLKVEDEITPDLINDLMYRLDTKYETDKDSSSATVNKDTFTGSTNVSQKWSFVTSSGNELNEDSTFFALVDQIPNPEYDKTIPNSGDVYGWLSNSQRFIVDQYFKNQKPVSISEVVFKATNGDKLKENINGENFISPKDNGQNTWRQFYGLYDFLRNYVVETDNENWSKGVVEQIPGTSQYNFDTIFGNKDEGNVGQIRLNGIKEDNEVWWKDSYEIKNSEKLLTLSTDTDFSKITKYSVYDFLQSNSSVLYSLNLDTKDSTLPSKPSADQISNNLRQKWNFTDPVVASNIGYSIERAPDNSDDSKAANRTTITNALYATLNLIEKLDRKVVQQSENPKVEDEYGTSDKQSENKVYQVLNAKQGIIAFIDETDGLHITKINGYDILKKEELKKQTSNYFQGHDREYLHEVDAFEKLKKYSQKDSSGVYRYIYQDYDGRIKENSRAGDPFSEKLISRDQLNTAAKYGVSYNDINQEITNDYERFLVNNSILNGGEANKEKPSFYKFDLIKDAFNSVKDNETNEDKLNSNNSWLWDYVKNLLEITSDQDLLKKFFNFTPDDNLSSDMEDWYLEQMELNNRHSIKTGWTEFKNGWNSWNQAIDKTKKGSDIENKDLPLMKLAYGKFDEEEKQDLSHLNEIRNTKKFDPWLATKIQSYSFEISIGNYTNTKKGGHE